MRDHIFARALHIAQGDDCAVLVGLDLTVLATGTADRIIEAVSRRTGCDSANIVVSATHTHSSGPMATQPDAQQPLVEAVLGAVDAARTHARSARISFGTTDIDLNINRDLFSDGRWMVGPNPAGHSDKTVAVLTFRDDTDRPIAVYFNYAMHPVNFNRVPVISADFAGEASRYIERRYGADMVAVFAQGGSGDQNPRFLQPLNILRGELWNIAPMRDTSLSAEEGGAIVARQRDGTATFERNAPERIPSARKAYYDAALGNVDELTTAEGALLGEAVVNVMKFQSSNPERSAPIAGVRETFQCPGRDRADRENPVLMGALPPYVDGDPVVLREGVLRLGNTYIVTVNGEIYSEIASRIKREAPAANVIVTTLANGFANSGYIYSDAASERLTFEVIGSRLKPGCAESAIVAAAKRMIGRTAR